MSSGLVGVALAIGTMVAPPGAQAGRSTRVVSVPKAAAGKVAVAVVRFPARRGAPVPRLRRAGRASGVPAAAFVIGVARARVRAGGWIGLVATVNFAGGSSRLALERVAKANRGFVVDFVGDPQAYRGRLHADLNGVGRRAWTVDALELPPASADPAYRVPRVLLDEVRRLLVGKPDAAFIAALHGSKSGPPASPPPPPATPPPPVPPPSPPSLLQLSSDPFTNASSSHRAQVEPDSFAFGSTVVTAFQSGRFYDGGASDIGFAISPDAGRTWTNGFLPKLTKYLGGSAYDRASDPTVAYDAKDGVWLIASIAITETPSVRGAAVAVSRSTDGGSTWSAPVIPGTGTNLDKEWVVCDNHPASPFYGRCYLEWDDITTGQTILMSTSKDGGATWTPAQKPVGSPTGFAGQPLVQPGGRVVVVIDNGDSTALLGFDSNDGGQSWSAATEITPIYDHEVAGGLRTEPIPSAEIAGDGTIYVVWQDCRFRAACASNDLVMTSTTQAGYPAWSSVARIPLDPATSTVDHFIPGLGVDPATAGTTAHLTLAYYFYPQASCVTSTCELDVGLVSSADSGATWTAPTTIAGPMSLAWLAPTNIGAMVGDYVSTSYVTGVALPFFAAAGAPSADGSLNESIYTWR